MITRSILLCFLLVCLFSCKSKTAFDYSQQIVKMETDLAAEIAEADKKVSKFFDAGEDDSAAIITQQMEEMADRKLRQVQQLQAPDVKEGDNFKKAAVRYFTYLKTIYTSFNKFTRATTENAKEAERQRLARIVADKEEATRALQLAQQKFAEANNFRIEKVKSEVKSEK